ncbi:hypothetical protein BHE74_00042879, partial [Ensete ventricosum]
WASRTTPKTPTGELPFSLTFGTEAILPPEVVYPTLWVKSYKEEASDKQLRENLDLLEEKRPETHLRMLAYKKAIARLYNHKGRLAPNWEGPYRIVKTIHEGAYTLTNLNGKQLPMTWHISNLRKFYA